MNTTVRLILGLIAGIVVGGFVNMGIIMISGSIIPPPEGSDLTTPEGLKAAMEIMQPKHFIMPWLAHALGTLVGAFIAVKIARTKTSIAAMVVGGVFLIGGIMMVAEYPSPMWFNVVDLALAYFPMALLGKKLAGA